jgi:excisionase family DNA binding protein
MSEIILQGLSVEQLLQRLDKLIEDKLEQRFEKPENKPDDNLTRKEVAKLLRISLPTLHDWTKSGFIKHHKIQSRVLYKRSEVENALTSNSIQKHKRGFK